MDTSRAARGALSDWLRTGSPPAPPPDERAAQRLVAAADAEGVAGQLEEAVAAAGAAWPDRARQRLRARQRDLLARGLYQLQLGARLLGALERRGVRALPLKGLVLVASREVYRIESARPMADLDLLALGDFAAAAAELAAQGFVLEERADHAWRYRDPASRAAVELHHDVTSCPGFHPLDREGLWRRSRDGEALPRLPSREDLLLQLALHGAFQHGLRLSLVQWLDFRRLLEAGLEAPLVRELTRAARAEASLFAALSAARAVVGAAPPEALLDGGGTPTPRGARRWVAERLRDPLALTPGEQQPASPFRPRWALAGPRRPALVALTLSPPGPGAPRSALARAARGLRRALALAWRWGVRARLAPRPQPPAERTAAEGGSGE